MGGYLVNFAVYTCAMVGVIFLALLVFKKSMMPSQTNRKDSLLNIVETLSLSPRKTIHVVKAGGERFLIAADLDRTTFLTKLDEGNESSGEKLETRIFAPVRDFKDRTANIKNEAKPPVMRELLRKLNVNAQGG